MEEFRILFHSVRVNSGRAATMRLAQLVEYLDDFLRIQEVPDYRDAWNGLQVENHGEVTRIAAAVDATEASVARAVAARCDLLLVHHGLFWAPERRITGRAYRRLQPLLRGDVAVYSAHLPLDVHPEVGNNVRLAHALGIAPEGRFGSYEGHPLGVFGPLEVHREAFRQRLEEVLGGPILLIPGGPAKLRNVGVITGGAGSMIADAAAARLDAFVTGEGAHHTHADALEEGINVYYGGHYATETWGVRALAEHLAERFQLSWEFLDLPSGL